MNEKKGVAVVTGGAKGIGRAICIRLARDGYSVAVCCNESWEKACETADEIKALGGSACVYRFNVTNSDAVNKCFNQIEAEQGNISVLVNNAGVSRQLLFDTITDTEWHRMIDSNLTGAFYCSRAAVPLMLKRKKGVIINIASMWGETGGSCEVHYSASKAGVIGLTKALAKELGPSNINVNCVSPGVILTDMTSCFSEETINELKDETPLCRIGRPEDIAGAVSFLASEDASFITGQDIAVNGGIVI